MIKRGIIVYHERAVEAKKSFKNFAKKHLKFICVEYPYLIAKCLTTKNEIQSKKTLSDYCNFALSFIPQGEWLVKIDTDQIYDKEKLRASFNLPRTRDDIVFYFRMNLHCWDEKIYLSK